MINWNMCYGKACMSICIASIHSANSMRCSMNNNYRKFFLPFLFQILLRCQCFGLNRFCLPKLYMVDAFFDESIKLSKFNPDFSNLTCSSSKIFVCVMWRLWECIWSRSMPCLSSWKKIGVNSIEQSYNLNQRKICKPRPLWYYLWCRKKL